MNNLTTFKNSKFGEVRTVEINGEPYFVGKDVATVLGYAKPENSLSAHVDEEDKTTTLIQGTGTNYKSKTTIINESGLYSLILSSKLPTAKEFKRWVTSEILPTIRKHQAYMTPEMIDEVLSNPDTIIKLATELKEERKKTAKLQADNETMRPKSEYFDELVDRNLLTNFRETAKELGIAPKEFTKWLVEKKYLYRDTQRKLLPYENKNNGLFEVKECFNEKTDWKGVQTLVTPKGRETFRLLWR